jgi:glucose-1-phosphate cytidylyltransferase
MSNDCILDCGEDKQSRLRLLHQPEEWKITFADTGADTPTGGRIKIVEKYIDGDEFLLTYGDGVSDVDIRAVIELHKKKGKIGTLTGIHPASPFGIIEMEDNIAKSFKEKPRLDGIINGGFFVFKKKFFDYLSEDSVLEEVPLRKLSAERQLAVYEHSGFWACVDTFKDVERLKGMWNNGERPWTVWEQNKT